MRKSDPHLGSRYDTALITGASSGIGRALAMALVEQGVLVYGTTRYPDKAGLPAGIRWLEFEGATASGLQAFQEGNSKLLSKIDILVNNSGSSYFGKASAIPDAIRTRQHHLLFTAPRALSGTVMKRMQAQRKGAIINVSSLAARFPIPYMEDYSASKARLSEYTRGLIARSKGTGVVVIDFQPGDYRTNFNTSLTRHGEPDAESNRMWQKLEEHLQKGPPPENAARDLIAALSKGRSRTVTSGSFFQSKVAPIGSQLLPDRLVKGAIRKYYRI